MNKTKSAAWRDTTKAFALSLALPRLPASVTFDGGAK